MFIFIALLIILSCYVPASTIPDETKTAYFIGVTFIVIIGVLTVLFTA